jgi:hypothetical protein
MAGTIRAFWVPVGDIVVVACGWGMFVSDVLEEIGVVSTVVM